MMVRKKGQRQALLLDRPPLLQLHQARLLLLRPRPVRRRRHRLPLACQRLLPLVPVPRLSRLRTVRARLPVLPLLLPPRLLLHRTASIMAALGS